MSSLAGELTRVGLRSLDQVRYVLVDGPGDGRADADRLADEATDLVVLEVTASAAARPAIALLLDLEPVAVVGTALSSGWAAEVVAVRSDLRRVRPHLSDLAALLDSLGDPALARATRLLTGLSARRTPVLLASTTTVLAAALLARWDDPDAPSRWLASATPDDAAGRAALPALGLRPLLDLGLGDDAARYALALLREALGRA